MHPKLFMAVHAVTPALGIRARQLASLAEAVSAQLSVRSHLKVIRQRVIEKDTEYSSLALASTCNVRVPGNSHMCTYVCICICTYLYTHICIIYIISM